MARIRTVKPDLFTNERCAECSVTAVLTYIGLFTQADDQGRHRDNAAIITGVLWPLRSEHTPVHVEDDLQQLADAGLICRYTGCDGKRYLHIVGWFEHQKIDKPSQSRLPTCTDHHVGDHCGPCKGGCSRTTPPARGLAEDSSSPPDHPNGLSEGGPMSPEARRATSADQQDSTAGRTGTAQKATRKTPRQRAFQEEDEKAPRRLGEASTPGSRIMDPGSSPPTGRTAPAAVTVGDLVGEYVAACTVRPPGDVLAHLGRVIKKLLAEGVAVEHVRAGLARFAEIQGHPSRLPSLVNDSLNGRTSRLARPEVRPNVPAHQAWTNPTDAAAYTEEL
jgi:hypothetical protein